MQTIESNVYYEQASLDEDNFNNEKDEKDDKDDKVDLEKLEYEN